MILLEKITFFITIIILLTEVTPGVKARRSAHGIPRTDVEMKMRWKDLSLKTICEEEEWRKQFEPVQEKFTKCLGLKKIILDDDDPDNDADRLGLFRGEDHNPYCRIAKTWDACSHYLQGLNCIEPNSEELMRGRRDGFAGMMDDSGDKTHYDPDHMNSMVRPYKMQCEMAKFAYNYGPFGSHGHGMDYFGGDYDMPDMDPEGVPSDGDL